MKKTVYLVGKGISYDTGGADIKAGGIMAGMSRDKCGAASVAGFMKSISLFKPEVGTWEYLTYLGVPDLPGST